MANGREEAPTAPYLTWGSFERFLRGLEVLPPKIDATLMTSMSGTAQSQMRGALRFFGFIEDGEDPLVTDRLRELHRHAKSPEWEEHLAKLVLREYDKIVEGVDLSAATQGQLEEAFRARGAVTGSARKKAVRFYLTAMTKAGRTYSPHFPSVRASPVKKSNGNSSRSSRPRRKKADVAPEAKPPGDTRELSFPVPGGKLVRVWWPRDLSKEEEEFVLSTLTGYLKIERGEAKE